MRSSSASPPPPRRRPTAGPGSDSEGEDLEDPCDRSHSGLAWSPDIAMLDLTHHDARRRLCDHFLAWYLTNFEARPPAGRPATSEDIRIELFLSRLSPHARQWCERTLPSLASASAAAALCRSSSETPRVASSHRGLLFRLFSAFVAQYRPSSSHDRHNRHNRHDRSREHRPNHQDLPLPSPRAQVASEPSPAAAGASGSSNHPLSALTLPTSGLEAQAHLEPTSFSVFAACTAGAVIAAHTMAAQLAALRPLQEPARAADPVVRMPSVPSAVPHTPTASNSESTESRRPAPTQQEAPSVQERASEAPGEPRRAQVASPISPLLARRASSEARCSPAREAWTRDLPSPVQLGEELVLGASLDEDRERSSSPGNDNDHDSTAAQHRNRDPHDLDADPIDLGQDQSEDGRDDGDGFQPQDQDDDGHDDASGSRLQDQAVEGHDDTGGFQPQGPAEDDHLDDDDGHGEESGFQPQDPVEDEDLDAIQVERQETHEPHEPEQERRPVDNTRGRTQPLKKQKNNYRQKLQANKQPRINGRFAKRS